MKRKEENAKFGKKFSEHKEKVEFRLLATRITPLMFQNISCWCWGYLVTGDTFVIIGDSYRVSPDRAPSFGFLAGTCSFFVCMFPSLHALHPSSHTRPALAVSFLDLSSTYCCDLVIFCCCHCYFYFFCAIMLLVKKWRPLKLVKTSQHLVLFVWNIPKESKCLYLRQNASQTLAITEK